MIDLNEVWRPPVRYDLEDVRERICATAAEWLPHLFPQARLSADRKTLRCADLSGRPPRNEGSCVIHLRGPRAGWAYDHATGECAGPIDLIHHATGLTSAALFEEAARLARLPQAATRRAAADNSHEVARILAGCGPLAGTIAERYLEVRGLQDPVSADLLFNADLSDFETRRGWPGMVARVRNGAGEPTGGIHRTFLLDDGSTKASPGKKMLGPVAGGSVRLSALGNDGHLGVAEGIETALSARAIFGIPTWSALSADGLRKWEWPHGVRHVTIFADAGDAGAQAAAALAERLNAAGIANITISPLHGDDFNDDLRHGATADDYTAATPPATAALATAADFESAARALTKPPELQALGTILGQIVTARLEPLPERQVLSAIKVATGIPVAVLEKQIGELRRRLNATGDINQRPISARWASQLRRDEEGRPERNEANVITALENDEAFAGALVFDEFRQEILVNRRLPWDQANSTIPRAWSDADDVRCAEWLQRRDINVTPVVVSRSVGAVTRAIPVHPVRDYLRSLSWDGTPRIESWTLAYLGADDTRLNRAFGALWMISAVARIMRPGVKVDHMLILEGPQGAKKSSALKVLAGADWFTDELAEIGSKDAAQQMRGVWVIEIAELDAISRAEVSRIKAFLTRTTDRYRPPYGRYVVEVARQCVFAGSVNPDTYLRDETGNRRFWPVRCGSIDLDALARDRDQLWAEAAARFDAGAVWWLDEPELIAMAAAEQDARYQSDAWDALIERWLTFEKRRVDHGGFGYDDWRDEEIERTNPLMDVSVGEILEGALGIEPARWTKADQMRVGAFLKTKQWERYQARIGTLREWRYRRG
ncbi:VapE domain-containing protein [Bradyrhizobium sp. HKCCYLRH3095]|uniref:VapE domain-containing protein n=1 Tax=Bradyrhizobium sp. HKCCYLRH3095 TaxID=3420765 RepID=UPI003EC084C6